MSNGAVYEPFFEIKLHALRHSAVQSSLEQTTVPGFCHLIITILDLFRISIFEAAMLYTGEKGSSFA